MPNQLWYCEICSRNGRVSYKPYMDVLSVAYAIERNHEKVSRGCLAPMEKIRAPVNKKALQELIESRSKN